MRSVAAEHRFVQVRGLRARVTEVGQGPRLLLLPSMLVLADSYEWLLRRLALRHRVTLIEMPGCGRGARLERPWGFGQYADWLAAYLTEAEAGPLPMVGHSNSGAVAMILAARRPQLVSRLVLADPVGLDMRLSLPAVLAGRAVDALRELPLSVWGFGQPLYNLVRHTRNCLNQIALAAWSDLCDVAREIRVPALLAWGAADRTVPLSCLRLARRLIPHAQVHVARAGSHDWLITHARVFAGVLERFLGEPRA